MSGEGLKINLIRIWWWTWRRCILDRVFRCGAFNSNRGMCDLRCPNCLEPKGAMDWWTYCEWCGDRSEPMERAPDGCLRVSDGVCFEDRS